MSDNRWTLAKREGYLFRVEIELKKLQHLLKIVNSKLHKHHYLILVCIKHVWFYATMADHSSSSILNRFILEKLEYKKITEPKSKCQVQFGSHRIFKYLKILDKHIIKYMHFKNMNWNVFRTRLLVYECKFLLCNPVSSNSNQNFRDETELD